LKAQSSLRDAEYAIQDLEIQIESKVLDEEKDSIEVKKTLSPPTPAPIPTPTSNAAVTILTPNGGEIFCRGDLIPIRWQTASDIELVHIGVKHQFVTTNLGDFSADRNVYMWDGTDIRGRMFDPSETLKIHIYTNDRGVSINDDSNGFFSFVDC